MLELQLKKEVKENAAKVDAQYHASVMGVRSLKDDLRMWKTR